MNESDTLLPSTPWRVAMVAGEASGDRLGADLIKVIKHHHPDACCYGIGGPLMIAAGFESLFPMERLSVMGLVEVLGRLWELTNIRRQLRQRFLKDRPDIFVGIDAPDFNLGLEKQLKQAGIATVHYVSPQIWAWRQGRLPSIKQSVDHMLTLFPFEARYYRDYGIPVTCVGHPLADTVPMVPDTIAARRHLKLSDTTTKSVVALLPGSRKAEVARLGPLFLMAARLLHNNLPPLQFLIPCANALRKQQLVRIRQDFDALDITLYNGQAATVMAAADAVLVASGTATLEAALYKKPMVVSYRMHPLTFAMARRLVKVKYVALPNLLAGRQLVPEILQGEATPDNLYKAMKQALTNATYAESLVREFTAIHQQLKKGASALAYGALHTVIEQHRATTTSV